MHFVNKRGDRTICGRSSSGYAWLHGIPLGCLALMLLLGTTNAQVGTSGCTMEDNITEWCMKAFGKSGIVTAERLDEMKFLCVCNDKSAIEVEIFDVGGEMMECRWDGAFDNATDGDFCYDTTGICPARCGDVKPFATECVKDNICNQEEVDLNFSCTTCEGRVYSILSNTSACIKELSPPTACNPSTTCSGHGCCNRPGTGEKSPCNCYRDLIRGFWAGDHCSVCMDGYDSNKGAPCTNPTPTIQMIISSIGTTWTMVLPNMAVMFLFVVLGLARRHWASDTRFEMTALRRANLSPVQLARRRQHGLFHSKYIPKRPAKSRCFLVQERETTRGPPAY